MPANLPIDVVRTFVAIVDAGSMLKAADRVFLSQSALSLQVKRLEELLQQPLFSREGRRLVLTPSGEAFLTFARRMLALNDEAVRALSGAQLNGPVRIGMVQDYAEAVLGGVLAQFARLHPEAAIHARVGGTLDLLALLESDSLDLVLGYSAPGAADELRRDPMIWIGEPDLVRCAVLPLAVLEKPCRFREAAVDALTKAGRPYRIAIETPNLHAARGRGSGPRRHEPHQPVWAGDWGGPLPTLPDVGTHLWVNARSDPAERLAGLVRPVVLRD